MPTKDDFNPDHFFPLLLSDEPFSLADESLFADEPDEHGVREPVDRTVISSRILTAGILVMTATAIGIAILSVGNRVRLFGDVTAASQVDKSALQPNADKLTPAIQFAADTEASPPAAKDAPARGEMAAASEPARQNETEKNESPEVLFRQFEAWAAEQDAQAQVGPVQPVQDISGQVAQNVPAQVAENTAASLRSLRRHRQVRAVQNARAETRPVQYPRKLRREQTARLQSPPAQGARAQDHSAQNAQAVPSFLQALGWRN